jgi:hypothetical protein
MSEKPITGKETIVTRTEVSVETERNKRVSGLWKGEFEVPDSFFDPLPPEELGGWESGCGG